MSLYTTYQFIARHPLTRERKMEALGRWARWQLASRITQLTAAVPFVDNTRLLVRRGMTGATGNIYCGLHEFEDMGFTLHFLRPGDLFLDIGANVGTYSLLAATAGARVMSFEPVPSTFEALLDNIHINRFDDRMLARREAVGDADAVMRMIADQDATNRVLPAAEPYAGQTVEVRQTTIDNALQGREMPQLIKVDVEGFESKVIEGAKRTLNDGALQAVIMEINGSGKRYGSSDPHLLQAMISFGFTPCTYNPLTRHLSDSTNHGTSTGNTLFVRSPRDVQARLTKAPKFEVQGCAV